ncbi:hypothetical protein FOA52_007567 [Chlamydomonas sp. UWO 241]|nr:hypothetical protein FOA52_007567 [Chlamydomonas sp. UWO 241]
MAVLGCQARSDLSHLAHVAAPLASASTSSGINYTQAAEADRVASLPGWGPIKGFGLFSGYLIVDEDAGRALFYALAESQVSPADDPLVLWLNGGPGCSSIGGGFMSENGPFFPQADGKSLKANPHAWNQHVTMLFLEVPAFVGFSYSNTSSDRQSDDATVRDDSYAALQAFMQRFPHYARSELYIAGESYAGHYIPQLATRIVQANRDADASEPRSGEDGGSKTTAAAAAATIAAAATVEPRISVEDGRFETAAGASEPDTHEQDQDQGQDPDQGRHQRPHAPHQRLNLKGILVGNPSTDRVTDRIGAGEFLWFHGVISDETLSEIRHTCSSTHDSSDDYNGQSSCGDAFDRAREEMGDINIYDIYVDLCLAPPYARAEAAAFSRALSRHPDPTCDAARPSLSATIALHAQRTYAARLMHKTQAAGSANRALHVNQCSPVATCAGAAKANTCAPVVPFKSDGGDTGMQGDSYDPCVDNEVEAYLNLPDVQKALHVNQTVIMPWRWTDCSDEVDYDYDDMWNSQVPLYEELIRGGGLRITIFSGDVDGMVPLAGTRRWTAGLGLKTVRSWRPWFTDGEQVAGHYVAYDGLTFVTVRGAGHMVPYTQPERASHLLAAFLAGLPPRSSESPRPGSWIPLGVAV